MENLPAEILDKIFKRLPLPQKQECMFVCKQWAQVITKHSIFHTIKINDKEACEIVLDFFNRSPSRGAMVKHLELMHCMSESFDTRNVLRLFPNLKTLKLADGDILNMKQEIPKSKTQKFVLEHRKTRLEVFEDYNECILTRFLVENDMCAHLVTLRITIFRNCLKTNVSSMLANMPMLKTLIIFDYHTTTFDEIEKIHANIPSLEEFDYRISSGTPPTFGISPAVSIKNLSANLGDFALPLQVAFSRYVLAKYPNVEHLNITNEGGANNNDMAKYYSNGVIPLLQHFGPQLKTFVFDQPESYPDIIKKLDKFDCKIKCFDVTVEVKSAAIMEALAFSKQKEYIEDLRLDFPFTSLRWLKELTRLKKLSLSYNDIYDNDDDYEDENIENIAIDLNELLDHCPETCESITIYNAILKLSCSGRKKYHLKKLKLHRVKFLYTDIDIDKFISKKLPDLHSLSLIRCLENHTTLYLPKHHFSFFEINNSRYPFATIVDLVTSDRKASFYSNVTSPTPFSYRKLDQYLLPMPSEDLNTPYFTTLTCASVKKLVLDDVEAFLVSDMEQFSSLKKRR